MAGVSKAPQDSHKSGSGRREISRSQAGDWESLGPASGNLVAFPRKRPSLEDGNISLAKPGVLGGFHLCRVLQ